MDRHRPRTRAIPTWCLAVAACGRESGGTAGLGGGAGDPQTSGWADGDDSTGPDDDGDAQTADTTGTVKYDVAGAEDGTDSQGSPSCAVGDDLDAVPPCTELAPPDSFDPELEWSFGQDPDGQTLTSMVIPLVANLTDDNGDGAIDPCDTPDVIFTGITATESTFGIVNRMGHIYALRGDTGELIWKSEAVVDASATPALGDLDGDGVVEIVTYDAGTLASEHLPRLIALGADGALAWSSPDPWSTDFGAVYTGWHGGTGQQHVAIAIADLDNDGAPEIIAGTHVHDAQGVRRVVLDGVHHNAGMGTSLAPTAADLDGDGDLEIVTGNRAYHHDGSLLWAAAANCVPAEINGGTSSCWTQAFPQVANLDDDPEPEIITAGTWGLSLLEHDGTITVLDSNPTGDPKGNGGGVGPSGYQGYGNNWYRASAVHDFDGDGDAEFAMSSADHFSVFDGGGDVVWSTAVADLTGVATGTAFDFLGDGIAEAIYADEQTLFVYDGASGEAMLSAPRLSVTLLEYPVVADVDNDGSAEILVVSNFANYDPEMLVLQPALQVFRDREDRWVGARRIWNQHTYHVTNVREDGTIPAFETPHWAQLNTFRTQAQLEGGGVCSPEPAG